MERFNYINTTFLISSGETYFRKPNTYRIVSQYSKQNFDTITTNFTNYLITQTQGVKNFRPTYRKVHCVIFYLIKFLVKLAYFRQNITLQKHPNNTSLIYMQLTDSVKSSDDTHQKSHIFVSLATPAFFRCFGLAVRFEKKKVSQCSDQD